MIRIAIVEDKEHSFYAIKEHLEKYSKKTNRQCKTTWYKNGLDFISEYSANFDLVFMDIKMPHLNGMDAAKRLREIDQTVALIFITNMMQYAVKGYEVNALDFIVKPVKYFDFEMKMNKAIEYIQKKQDDTITIDSNNIKIVIRLSDLLYIEVLNHTLIYHTKKGDYATYGQLFKMEEILKTKNFVRCNNCYLINLRHVDEVHPDFLMVGNHEIQISRRKKKEFMKTFADFAEVENNEYRITVDRVF